MKEEEFNLKYRKLFAKINEKTDNKIIGDTILRLKKEAQLNLLKEIYIVFGNLYIDEFEKFVKDRIKSLETSYNTEYTKLEEKRKIDKEKNGT